VICSCLRTTNASALFWHHKTQPRNAGTDDLVIDLPAGAILHKVRLRGFPIITTQNIFQLQPSLSQKNVLIMLDKLWGPDGDSLKQGCTNPGSQVVQATGFCTVEPNTNLWVLSMWELLHFTLLALEFLRWLLDFWKSSVKLVFKHRIPWRIISLFWQT
jgi:hypothetical protein